MEPFFLLDGDSNISTHLTIIFYFIESSFYTPSLRLAKRHHLQQVDKTQAHPYFWAAFVQSGNAEALQFSNTWLPGSYWSLGMGLGLMVLLLGYFFFKRK